MGNSKSTLPSFADIGKSRGYTLGQLARAIGYSRSSLAQLEQNPPNKRSTWMEWSEEIVDGWPALLGSSFAQVFTSKAFSKCPPDIVQYMRESYIKKIFPLDEQPIMVENRNILEKMFRERAEQEDFQGRWVMAGEEYAKAANLWRPNDNNWVIHRLLVAQMRTNRGELDLAEEITKESSFLHRALQELNGNSLSPDVEAQAESGLAWIAFLRGKYWDAVEGFGRTGRLAYRGGNAVFLGRGLHMGARALTEPSVFSYYFPHLKGDTPANSSLFARGLIDIDNALLRDTQDSASQAFNLWYKGILEGLSGHEHEGRELLLRADSQLAVIFSDEFTPQSHSGLSLIHFNILASDGNPFSYQKLANQLQYISANLTSKRYPYALADSLIALVYCRYRAGFHKYSFTETADFLCLAFAAFPYPDHILWRIGNRLLKDILLPNLPDQERLKYKKSVLERATNNDEPFDLIGRWELSIKPLEILLNSLIPD